MYANIQGLSGYKIDSIQADYGYMSCDIIMLSECHMNINYISQIQLAGYTIINATGNPATNSSYGQVCYWREGRSDEALLSFVGHNADPITNNYNNEYNDYIERQNNSTLGRYLHFENHVIDFITGSSGENKYRQPRNLPSKQMVEISLFQYDRIDTQQKVFLIQIYNHPDSTEAKSLSNLLEELISFLEIHSRTISGHKIMLFGDLNVDFNDEENRRRWDIFIGNDYSLLPTLTKTCTRPRTKEINNPLKQRQLDWVFTNKKIDEQKTIPYCTWFSDHLPLYTKIDKF